MGYNVKTLHSTCKLPIAKAQEAYKLMCDLNQRNDLKRGRGYKHGDERKLPCSGPHPGIWFSWMDWNYPETLKNVQDVLTSLGFAVDNDDTYIHILDYDSKTGAEEHFFKAIEHFLEGAIAWKGEDGTLFGWKFENGKMNIIKTNAVLPCDGE